MLENFSSYLKIVFLGTYNTKHFLVISKDTRGSLEEFDGDFEFSQLTFTSVSITELDRDKDELFAFFTKSKKLQEKEKKITRSFRLSNLSIIFYLVCVIISSKIC